MIKRLTNTMTLNKSNAFFVMQNTPSHLIGR